MSANEIEYDQEKDYIVNDDIIDGLTAGDTARVYTTPDKWYGVTYREDRAEVVDALARMTAEGLYPTPMWP